MGNQPTRTLLVSTTVIVLAITILATIATPALLNYRKLDGKLMATDTYTIWYQDPGTSGVTVSAMGLNADVSVNMQPLDIALKERHAIYYNTFDSDPSSDFETRNRCNDLWGWNNANHYIYINVSGLDGLYCYFYPKNVDISGYARNGDKVYVSAIMWRSGYRGIRGTIHRIGFTYLDSSASKSYLVGLRNEFLLGNTGDYATADAYYYRNNRRSTLLGESSLGSGAIGFEYDYYHNLSAGIDFSSWTAELWGKGQTIGSSQTQRVLSASIGSSYRIIPDRVGIGVHEESGDITRGYLYFDNFIITVNAKPWLVNITGLQPGWRVVLKDSTGGIVDEGYADSDGVASLEVWGYLIIPNAMIEVYDSDESLVVSKSFDYLVGGDVYEVIRFTGAILDIYSNLPSGFDTRLEVISTNCTLIDDSYLYIYLYNEWGDMTGPIEIRRGNLVNSATGYIMMTPPSSWTGSWKAGSIELTAYMPSSVCIVELRQEFQITPGVYTYGYINVTVKSS